MLGLRFLLGAIMRTTIGRTVGLSVAAVLAFMAFMAWNNAKVAREAVEAAEAERQRINNEITSNIIDAIAAARRCRALDGMRWNFVDARCERGQASGDAADRGQGDDD